MNIDPAAANGMPETATDCADRARRSGTVFSVDFPWILDENRNVEVAFESTAFAVDATFRFLRFDFYPLRSPSHPERHLAYFDLPLNDLHGAGIVSAYSNQDKLVLRHSGGETIIDPVWRGTRPLAGYSRLTVSLWQVRNDVPERLNAVTSPPMLLLGDEIPSLERIMVAVTQRCNLTCPMCTRQRGADFDQADISDEVLAALLDAAPQAAYVGLQGIGEPLMNKNLEDIVRAFRARMSPAGRLALTTNGTSLTRKRAERLIAEGINTITISADGATRATFEERRTGANFERVFRNAAAAAECARTSGRDDVWICANFIMDGGNLHEVPQFVRLAAASGLSAVGFFHARLYPGMELAALNPETLRRVREEALQIGRQNGVNVRFANSKASSTPPCHFMNSAYLWLTGEVAACDRMEPPGRPWPTRIFGNVRKLPLLDIWNLPEYRAFRQSVLSGNLPAECRDCTFCDSVVC